MDVYSAFYCLGKPLVNFFESYLIAVQLWNNTISGMLESAEADAEQKNFWWIFIKIEEAFHMQIGEMIRKHRKMKNMTQEEMARRLGVTAPAVNKWENGNSLPDIMLLAPIARLLDITLDTLLSFHEELTEEEINQIVREMDDRLRKEPYEEMFQWAKKKMEQYPNSDQLAWQLALILDAQRMLQAIPEPEKYDAYICGCYTRALESSDEEIRHHAADSLFGFYLRKEQFETAEKYLGYYSNHDPEKKRKQAQIYAKTGRLQEAYKTYEELLFSSGQFLMMVFQGMLMLAIEEPDKTRAHMLVKKQQDLAKLFEMGKYYEVCYGLDLVVAEKDVEATLDYMEDMLSSVGDLRGGFRKAPLYEHMTFKDIDENSLTEMKKLLIKFFQDEETFEFLKGEKRWEEICSRLDDSKEK